MDEHDQPRLRCRRLGHEVPLSYCRTQEGATVCPCIRDCWWEAIDIDDYLRRHLSPQEYQRLLDHPESTSRLGKIIQLAQQARQATNKPQ